MTWELKRWLNLLATQLDSLRGSLFYLPQPIFLFAVSPVRATAGAQAERQERAAGAAAEEAADGRALYKQNQEEFWQHAVLEFL